MATRTVKYDRSKSIMIFEGSKTCWRTRSNMEIFIMHHIESKCIELVVYNAKKGIESPRIYFDAAKCFSKLDKKDIEISLGEKKEVFIRQRKSMNNTELTNEVLNELSVGYVLGRMYVKPGPIFEVAIKVLSTDTVKDREAQDREDTEGNLFEPCLDVILDHCPPSVEPLQITFTKATTSQDFNNALKSLRKEAGQLKLDTTYAEISANSIDKMKNKLVEKWQLELELKRSYSEPRRRWVSAINQVLIQNYIIKVTKRLQEIEEAKKVQELEAAMGSPSHGIPSAKSSPDKKVAHASLTKRSAKSRTTLDNSSLQNSKLPQLNSAPLLDLSITSRTITANEFEMEGFSLPSIEEHSFQARRRRRQIMNYRKSFDLCYSGGSRSIASNMSLSTCQSSVDVKPPMSFHELLLHAEKPSPSLRSSYSDKAMEALTSSLTSSVKLH